MTENLLTGDVSVIDENKNYLEELVGENKKFATPEDLAKGKFHADQTIELMKKRLDDLSEEYRKVNEENLTRAKLEDLLDKMANKQISSENNPPANSVTQQPAYDPKQIESLVSNQVQAIERQKKETDNFNQVKTKLTERYGANYASVLKTQIESMGLTDADANALAKKSPQAFIKTFGLEQDQQDSYTALPRTQQRNDSFAPTGRKERTWAYYQEMYKKDPTLKFDRNTAIQMQKDAIDLGDRFRDGDYYKRGLHEPNT